MLVPAYVVKADLEAAFAATLRANPSHLRWYRTSGGSNWVPEPVNDDWNWIARASLSGGRVVGYMHAATYREVMAVTEIAAVSLSPGSVTFLRDLHRFMADLRAAFRVVRFTCVVGNPAERIWRRWVEDNGGREVGVLHACGRAADGAILDAHLFETPGLGS